MKVNAVTDFGQAKTHCDTLVDGLRELAGAGLAANQIGLNLNIFAAEVRKTELFPERPESPLIVMLNAEILATSTDTEDFWEGCLSIPGLMGMVPRYEWIEVQYHTREGEQKIERYEGYLARVLQHEIDHLAGRFYLDRMPTMLSLTTKENYVKHVIETRKQAPPTNQAPQ